MGSVDFRGENLGFEVPPFYAIERASAFGLEVMVLKENNVVQLGNEVVTVREVSQNDIMT